MHKWEPSELNGGKFCEVVYSILNGYLGGSFPKKPSKPSNMLLSCQLLEKIPANSSRVGDRSLRILIPRMLPVLYEIRSNRGVGHVGGDVDPNFLDATAVYGMASWVLAELVRILHNVSTKEAQEIVDALIERKISLIWEIKDIDIYRILNQSMSSADQTLVFLHRKLGWVLESDLIKWVEYRNTSQYRSKILVRLHKNRYLEYDSTSRKAHISPKGTKEVEERILKVK